MASSSSYPHSAPASSSSESCNYDLFLSFRGENTRKTFVDHLYSALVDRKIFTYKDDETLGRGEIIRSSLFKAIEGSKIAVIIFSESYGDSSWCLEELAHIMKCKDERELIVMPIFYDVDPSDVRKQEGNFGKGFAKQKVGNTDKVEVWRKALVGACEIAGWETKNIANGHESKGIKKIVDAIFKKLDSITSDVDEEFVGIRVRLEELEAKLNIGSDGVQMVGIWGCGGSGKTTLATSMYNKISSHFQGRHCILDSIREKSSKHGLETLQQKILSKLLNTKVEVESVEKGKQLIRRWLSRSNVLILLDDVDDDNQLDALAGSHKWFGSGSRIIITTRDEHILKTHKVDHVCPIRLLSHEESVKLFNEKAYNENMPIRGYETLSSLVVSYAAGLPLALKVLGSFLYDKDENEWGSALIRLEDTQQTEIWEQLKISYDGLESVEQELFLDIACFFRWESLDKATKILEACHYHPGIGIKVLRQKALININVDGKLDMHDLIQEMGHNIVRRKHPNNPEKHSRVWKNEEIETMYLGDGTMENNTTEAIQYHGNPSLFYKIISNMKNLRWLSLTKSSDYNIKDVISLGDATMKNKKTEAIQYQGNLSLFSKTQSYMKRIRWLSLTESSDHNVKDVVRNVEAPIFISNELCYIHLEYYPKSPFPDNFQPNKLVTLELVYSLQEKLWNGCKHLPCLKELELFKMENLPSTPDFNGLPCLQKLKIDRCESFKSIHPSLGYHKCIEDVCVTFCFEFSMFPTIVHMGKLKTLKILQPSPELVFPKIESNMESLVKLSLNQTRIDHVLLASIGEERFAKLVSLDLSYCHLENNESSPYAFKNLEEFKLTGFSPFSGNAFSRIDRYRSASLTWLSSVLSLSTGSLRKLNLSDCHLRDGEIPAHIGELSNLRELSLRENDFSRLDFSLLQLTRLKNLALGACEQLVELPELPSNLAILEADYCDSLTTIPDSFSSCQWLCEASFKKSGIITDSTLLLHSMLQGKAIENRSMLLKLEGLEIAKGFTPPLVRGVSCTLKLPENWCNVFCGFLMCAVITHDGPFTHQSIHMEHVMSGIDIEEEEDVLWEESESDGDKYTWVFYVPFVSLKNIAWWNPTSNAISISKIYTEVTRLASRTSSCSGFGVRLVARKSGSGATETSAAQEESEYSHYIPKFDISHTPPILSVTFPNIVLDFLHESDIV